MNLQTPSWKESRSSNRTTSERSVPENYGCRVKRLSVVGGSSMYLPKHKKVHTTSISLGPFKVWWNLYMYCDIAMYDPKEHYQTSINSSVLKRSPTKLI